MTTLKVERNLLMQLEGAKSGLESRADAERKRILNEMVEIEQLANENKYFAEAVFAPKHVCFKASEQPSAGKWYYDGYDAITLRELVETGMGVEYQTKLTSAVKVWEDFRNRVRWHLQRAINSRLAVNPDAEEVEEE